MLDRLVIIAGPLVALFLLFRAWYHFLVQHVMI